MVIYEVNLAVEPEIDVDWRDWIGPHMAELVSLDGFEAANLYRVEAEQETATIHYTVQYQVKSREALECYFQEHAPRLRQEGLERFGDRFQATRRIYQSVEAGQ